MTETRAGRHRPARNGRKLWPIVAAVVLCVAAGGTAWGLTRDGHSRGATSPTSSTGSHRTTGSPSASASSPTTPPSNSPTADPSAVQALTACRSTLATGTAMVAAADQNYADWSGHVYAQVDYDQGKITFAQGEAIWKRTKLAGPADLKAYDTAKTAWDQADQKACDQLQAGDGATQSTVSACTQRAAAMTKVINLSGPVYAGWKGHQIQMTHTQEKSSDPNAYFNEWFGRVKNAQPALAAYKSAHDAYDKTAACPAA